jgi:HD-GYP domain-containing protein (c-di-GMP phosphodiesterase class II)
MFGRHLNFDRDMLEELALGGMLLDIGNAMLPKSIAATAGPITDEQKAMLRQHVEMGAKILSQSQGVPQTVADMVICHHERFDGSGYPRRLYGNQIPPFGRIAGIADAYDAMTSETPYSKPMAAYDAARALNDLRGKAFAAEVVEQFLATMGMFPVGSLVELNDGSVAVVLEQNPNNVLRPKVLVLLDENRTPLPQPKLLEMRELPMDATQSNAKWIVGGHEHGAFGIDPADIFS